MGQNKLPKWAEISCQTQIPRTVSDLLLDGGPVDRRHEFVAGNFRLLLRELSVALARADRVEFPDGLGRTIRLQNVFQ